MRTGELNTLVVRDLHLREQKAGAAEFLCSCRTVGPPPSRRQYHNAKTITLVSQSNAPERRSWSGASLCDGKARTNRITEPISASVVMPLMAIPSARFSERFPLRWLMTVGTSSPTIKVGNSHVGPMINERGSAK